MKPKISEKMGLSGEYIFGSKKTRKIKESEWEAKRQMINDFLKRESNSSQLPSKYDANANSPRFGLRETITILYDSFRKEYPSLKVSRAFIFQACNKKCIKSIKHTARRQCVCMQCTNIKKLEVAANIHRVYELSGEDLREGLKKKLMDKPHVNVQQWERIADTRIRG